jgi:hypothetical protein
MVNAMTVEGYQIMVDQSNVDMLTRVAKLPPGSVVLVNWPASHEYFPEFEAQVHELYSRPDIQVAPLRYESIDIRDAGHPRFVLSLLSEKELWPGLRGPMLELEIKAWNSYWEGVHGPGAAPFAEGMRQQQLVDFGFHFPWCAAFSWSDAVWVSTPCRAILRPVIDMRIAAYGWRLDAYRAWNALPAEPAVFLTRGAWIVQDESGKSVELPLGEPGDVPLAGDWDGDGRREVAVYRPSTNSWMLDVNMDGKADRVFQLAGMTPTDVPLAGDWDGDGKDTPGYYRPSDGTWHLFNSLASVHEDIPIFHLGGASDIPLAGDWDNDRHATPGVFDKKSGLVTLVNVFRDNAPLTQFNLPPGGSPVVANWSGIGSDTVNTIADGQWVRRFANCRCDPGNPIDVYRTDLPPGRYFVGRWKSPAMR